MLWISFWEKTLYEKAYHNPDGIPMYDSAPGGNVSLRSSSILSEGSFSLAAGFIGFVVNADDTFAFIPTASALDIQYLNNTSLSQVANSGTSQYPSRLQRFMTQAPETINGQTIYNSSHPFPFLRRTAIWIFREMEPSINVPNFNYSTQLCNRPCAPTLPSIIVNQTICDTGAGNQLFVNIPTGTGIVWNTSQGLSVVYQGNPSVPYLRWDGTQTGSGWVEASLLTDAGCSFPLNRVAIWAGEPSTGFQVITTVPKIGGTYILCVGQFAKFTFVPNTHVEMGLQGFETEAVDCAINQVTTQQGGGRTEFTFTAAELGPFDADCVGQINIRAMNDCGNGDWTSVPFVVTNICELFSGGSPCPPNVLCDRLTTEAFENPFGSGFRYRMMGIPSIDYYRLTDATLAGFDYQVQVFDGQGDMKRQIQTSTVQTYIDMDNLPAGNYYVRTLFSNGSYTSLRTVVKQ